MIQWKQIYRKPAGALPGNIITRIGVGTIAVLGGALMLTNSFTDRSENPSVAQDTTAQPANRGVQQQLSALIDRETERQEQRRAAAALDELRRQATERATSNQPRQASMIPALRAAGEPLAELDSGPTEDEMKLRETLRLEDIERRTRSLRSPPLVQSYRSTNKEEQNSPLHTPRPGATQQTQVPEPQPFGESGLRDVVADLRDSLSSLQDDLEGSPSATTPADPSASAPDPPSANTAGPARISQPSDPPGWERIYEGAFLEGVLLTQLSGDFPGPALAMVSVPFYSQDRQRVLIPRGARVVGTAREITHHDQERLAVTFHRLLFPDGRWVSLEFQGLNQVGESALKDKVNRHYVSVFAAAGAVGTLSGLTLQGSNPYTGGIQGFRAGSGQGFGLAATQILQRFLNRLPTVTIRAGHRLRIWFTSDVLVPTPDLRKEKNNHEKNLYIPGTHRHPLRPPTLCH